MRCYLAIHAETIRRFSRRASCGFRPSFCLFHPTRHSFFSLLRHDLPIPVYLRSITHCSLSIQHVCPKDSSARAGTLIKASPLIVDAVFSLLSFMYSFFRPSRLRTNLQPFLLSLPFILLTQFYPSRSSNVLLLNLPSSGPPLRQDVCPPLLYPIIGRICS